MGAAAPLVATVGGWRWWQAPAGAVGGGAELVAVGRAGRDVAAPMRPAPVVVGAATVDVVGADLLPGEDHPVAA